ncbi:MAG: VOC family protein [Desulfatitalea sp.]|nr:VOC family protein [Desulfatitalea sp.]
MSLELDHVFIFVSEGAPEADKLIKFGFSEGEPNVHPGQGTSNRRFFFDNMMLELLWVSNIDEAKSELTRQTMLWERWNERKNISPFGLIFRSSSKEVPFKGWEYKPKYLPDGLSFLVGNNSGILTEPIILKMPNGDRPAHKKNPILQNISGFNNVSSLCVKMPLSLQSSTLRTIGSLERISFEESDNHVMEIGFDKENSGKAKDFFPELPLIIKW